MNLGRRPSLLLATFPAWGFVLAGFLRVSAEEMKEIAPGSRQGRSQVEASEKIRPPFLQRIEDFDLRGRRVPSAAPDPGPVPSGNSNLSPAQRKKALELMDRRKNWLLENAATIHRLETGETLEDELEGDEESLNPGMTRSLNRLLQATGRSEEFGTRRNRNDPEGGNARDSLSSTEDEEDIPGSGGGRRGRDVGVRLIPENGLEDHSDTRGRSSGIDVRPDRARGGPGEISAAGGNRGATDLFPDQRRGPGADANPASEALTDRRAGAFEQLLAAPAEEVGAGGSAAALFGRSTEARSSAFQSLLQAPEWTTGSPSPAVGGGLFATPGPGGQPGAAARPLELPKPGGVTAPAFTLPAAAAAPRPAPVRIEPRPLFLPIPSRSNF